MSSSSNAAQTLGQASSFNDLASLDKLRSAAQKDKDGALREVAQQFESIFMQMVMKGMRQANAAFESDLMNSNYTDFYRDMADQQMSLNMAQQGALGLADIMVQQLNPEAGSFTPASVLRGGEAIPTNADSDAEAEDKPLTMPPELAYQRRHKQTVDKAAADPSVAISQASASAASNAPAAEPVSFADPQEFVDKLLPMATKTAQALGVNPAAILAQAALETGWGQKVIRQNDGASSNNLFNIKANNNWQGDRASVSTLEFEEGLPVRKMAAFRSYENIQQSFDDYENLLTNSSRYKESLGQKYDSAGFLQELQKAGYATDPKYADKAISVLQRITGMLEL
ncbi:flagellar assembly peptidoglycan hydrolase FlgJ [Neiella marina]|uniref:Peptidoglycan hydrolase FlgJ n=1 Tax=Neiella holothuriorum TaxID=2870530 RepID=A0ABS7EER2_9GAMM|nr:flagellar assembly peptidoglycan hydrolase FlgJ [Neiella holothuriorum]